MLSHLVLLYIVGVLKWFHCDIPPLFATEIHFPFFNVFELQQAHFEAPRTLPLRVSPPNKRKPLT